MATSPPQSSAFRDLLAPRVAWLLLPVLIGPALADALSDRSRSVQIVASLLAWSLWAAALVAMLVPRTVTLTIVRFVVPGAATVALWAALDPDRPAWAAVAVAAGAVAAFTLALPGVADAFVDGSSYGAERRVALRSPVAVLVPAALAWVVGAAGSVTGPLLLAAEQWVAGAVALVAGGALVAGVVVRLHLLSRRWLVFVPAGVVVHDPFTLTEPVLFQRHLVRRIGPAPVDSEALDVTGGALGLALEIVAAEPITVGTRRGRDSDEHDELPGLVVTPTRPAATLAIAAEHRLPVG